MIGQFLQKANYTVVFSGAGMSTESGLPDFRSSEKGLWKNQNPLQLATVEAMIHNREQFVSFYRKRITALSEVTPHEGYKVLAAWEKKGIVRSVITQNVDGFHEIAGNKNRADLHGTLRKCHCHSCGEEYSMDKFLKSEELTCECGGFIRPSVVLFGEYLPQKAMTFAEEESAKADLFIVLGSSLQVSPANMFPQIAKNSGAKLVIINMESTPLDDIADTVINNRKIGEVLKEADHDLN
jgi:NAD-dependent deacetylase